jgi:chromosome segregation ATPase
MSTRVGVLIFAVGCYAAGLTGCVSADLYRLKEQEVHTLHRANESALYQNKSLLAEKTALEGQAAEMKQENEGLKERIVKLNEEIVSLNTRAEILDKEGTGLRQGIEKLNAKIADLNADNKRLAALSSPENLLRSLEDRLADLRKRVEVLLGENEKLKNGQMVARTKAEKAGSAEPEKKTATSVEKPQAFLILDAQTGEVIKPDSVVRKEPSDKP